VLFLRSFVFSSRSLKMAFSDTIPSWTLSNQQNKSDLFNSSAQFESLVCFDRVEESLSHCVLVGVFWQFQQIDARGGRGQVLIASVALTDGNGREKRLEPEKRRKPAACNKPKEL
jgi:hypothetical protein